MAYLGIYRAIYDYTAQSAEELDISDGDLLFVLEKSNEDDWWKCKKKAVDEDDEEPEGLVPNNYIEEATPTHTAKALYDYTKQTDEELSFREDARLEVYDESDPDWTLVGCDGEYGFAPAIYIEALSNDPPAKVPSPAPPPMPPRPTSSDEPIPGEADYVPPPAASASGPAAAIAGIIAQKTGTAAPAAGRRTIASPPPAVPQAEYTPEESEEEAPPPKPARPQSQVSIPSPPPQSSPLRSPEGRSQFVSSGTAEAPGIMPSPPQSPTYAEPTRRPGEYHLYNIHEMVKYQGKSKKLPITLGINVSSGMIMISPEKSRDGPSQEWTADKLQHYSVEGKHVFLELVRPSKSADFHAGSKDTAQAIIAQLGELAGAARAGGLREVLDASKGSGADGIKTGRMLYEFLAQGDDEVTVAVDDEVWILDDTKSEEWWMVRRLKNGKEGVVPSSYVEITGMVEKAANSLTGLNAGRSVVEQNRLEEERLTKEAARRGKGKESDIPERGSSLGTPDSRRGKRGSTGSGAKSRPNQHRVRTWTDRTGTFKVEAEFIGLREGKIHLHKVNGVKIAVPVGKMSVEDLEYVEKATGASLDDEKPLSDIKRRTTQKANGTVGATVDREKRAKDEDFWFDFFLSCGVDVNIVGRYVNAFLKDQMTPEVLPEVNESLLRTLGFKEGDILRVMKALDAKYGRQRSVAGGEDTNGEAGGLFSGPGGALRNNTRKSRPAPAVQTNDNVSVDALRSSSVSPGATTPTGPEGATATPLTTAPAREPKSGFEDDAWDVKPLRTQTPDSAPARSVEPPKPSSPAKPLINDDIASLAITSPPLEPTRPTPPPAAPAPTVQSPAAGPSSPQASQSAQPQQPQGADKAIFDKIAALAPAKPRPQPPPPIQQPLGAALVPPPPRASSAPGFPPQQNNFGPSAPLQPQLTGYASPQSTGYAQQQQQLQPQQTAFQNGGYQGQPPNGFLQQQQQPQPTGIQAVQQNYPALQPQPTGLNFQPQSQFGQQQQTQHYGPQLSQGLHYQQQLVNGAQAGSPFADPPRAAYQPLAPSGLHNTFTAAQPTGFQQPQPTFNISQPQQTAINGFQQQQQQQQAPPQLPPQQMGGVFGPSQPVGLNAPPAPLVAQKTGPAPPVRFGVQPGQNKLAPQPTGRANLSKATPQNPFGF